MITEFEPCSLKFINLMIFSKKLNKYCKTPDKTKENVYKSSVT